MHNLRRRRGGGEEFVFAAYISRKFAVRWRDLLGSSVELSKTCQKGVSMDFIEFGTSVGVVST